MAFLVTTRKDPAPDRARSLPARGSRPFESSGSSSGTGGGPGPRRTGQTIIELVIYIAVLGTIGVPILMITISATRSSEEGSLFSKLLERNRSALNRIGGDFRRCLSSTFTVTNNGKTLSFTLPGGFDGSAPITGDTIRYEIRPDPMDPANTIDDNGNGVVDESILVRINATAGEEVTIAPYLDTESSGFTPNGTGITVTLTTIGWTAKSTTKTKMTQTVVIYPRN